MSEIANQSEPAASRTPPDPAKRPPLHEILDDLSRVNHDVRKAAAVGARLAGVAPTSFLLPLLRDRNPMLRFAAVEALRLGEFKFSTAIVDTLLSKIDDRQSYIATAAIKALGRKRITAATEELISCLTMADARISAAALLALSEIGTTAIDEYIGEFLDSEDPISIRAAATIIGRQELTQFGDKLLELTDELVDAAEIPPQANKINHHLLAMREVIGALGALEHSAAIPRLKELGIGQIGLRSAALRTLHHLGVDIIDLACQAQERFSSANISRLLAEISRDFADESDLLKLDQRLKSNRDKLLNLGQRCSVGTRMLGKATLVAHSYAIIALEEEISAFMPASEFRWSPARDLKPFEQQLLQANEFEVIEVDQQRGRVKLSRRNLLPDPLAEFHATTTINTPLTGCVDGIIHYGVFVKLQPEIVGLLHVSKLGLLEHESPHDLYQVGETIDVLVEEVDLPRRRVRLDLAHRRPSA